MKKTKDEVKEKDTINFEELQWSGKYYYAVGKRKTSIAQVRLYPVEKSEKGIIVNGVDMEKYFSIGRLISAVKAPLLSVGQEDKADISVKVSGGGISGQAEAVRLGIARALTLFDGGSRKVLRGLGLLTRDARKVERKKPGLRKARRAPQWAKR